MPLGEPCEADQGVGREEYEGQHRDGPGVHHYGTGDDDGINIFMIRAGYYRHGSDCKISDSPFNVYVTSG